MKSYNFEFLQDTFDEQQTAIDNATGCLTFLSQVRANQRRQVLAAQEEIARLQYKLEEALAENTQLKNELFKTELRMQSLIQPSAIERLRSWVGTFKR
jgi:predicted RNase H-like nuclease (RuvC/YqgF family)